MTNTRTMTTVIFEMGLLGLAPSLPSESFLENRPLTISPISTFMSIATVLLLIYECLLGG